MGHHNDRPHSSKLQAFPAMVLHTLSLSGPESKFCEFCGVQDLAVMVGCAGF